MRRFFSAESFWNQPIGANPAIDPQSRPMLEFMAKCDNRGLWINQSRYTIPIYEVDASTPRRRVHRRLATRCSGLLKRSEPYLVPGHPMGHGAEFAEDGEAGLIPIPDYAQADPATDAHIALVDWENGWIWDMWAARRMESGDWEACTGMKYRADGSGVFDPDSFNVHDGESIHPYGPSRAAGVPALAGTIMHEEIVAGRIEHKLAFATQAAALQKFVYPPACWTDGGWEKGLPEGAVLQLDPALNLTQFGLSPAATTVAKALQEYGAVNVDVAGGHVLYCQGLYADPHQRSWAGLLEESALIHVLLKHFRVLEMQNVIPAGMGRRVPDGMYAGVE